MKPTIVALGLAGILGAAETWATAPRYENYGTVTAPLNIDATVFINGGLFNLSGYTGESYYYYSYVVSTMPFVTQNTMYYTNLASGIMQDSTGFRFLFLTNGFPYSARSFDNKGQIEGYLLSVKSDDIRHSGLMTGVGGGLVRLEGSNVVLRNGGISARGYGSSGGLGPSIVDERESVEHLYFATGEAQHLDDEGEPLNLNLLTMPNPQSPMHQVLEYSVGGGVSNIFLTNIAYVPSYYGYSSNYIAVAQTNQINPSNAIIQVIFVNTNVFDTNVTVTAGFQGRTAGIELQAPAYDFVTGTPYTNYIYFMDYAAGRTNFNYATNTYGEILRPDNYTMVRGTSEYYFGGPFGGGLMPGNTEFTNELIVNPTYEFTEVTNRYTAYSVFTGMTNAYGSVIDTGLNPALTDPTNKAGRIEIKASSLDLTRARMAAETVIDIQTTNLVSADRTIVDAPIVRLDLTSTNGLLLLTTNLLPSISKRLSGTISAYTALWTNNASVMVDTNTNNVAIKFHVLVLEQEFYGEQSVALYDARLKATNVVLDADLMVSKSLVVDAAGIHVRSNLYGAAFANFGATNFPAVKHLTNDGAITVQNRVNLGVDRADPIDVLVNRGTISGSYVGIKANSLENSGTLEASSGAVEIEAQVAKLDGGAIYADGDVVLKGQEYKVRGVTVSGSALYLDVPGRFSDGGEDAMSMWGCGDGFHLLTKPAEGDLLGTDIYSSAPQFTTVPHTWAGEDRGATAAGFSNNMAIGRLTLDGANLSTFAFSSPGARNALYVDYLNLQNRATNILDSLEVATNMTIYFAAANLPVEDLDGQLDGRLRWVSQYAGPNSTVTITTPDGQTFDVNASLPTSTRIDSDADSLVNAADPSPFDGVKILSVTVTNMPEPTALISWQAAAGTTYQIDYADSLPPSVWQPLTTWVNPAATNGVVTVANALPPGEKRYFRVGYVPGQ
ncbi:MAG: hypothetical protein KA118_01420 [Verrucomicrobia bacterium]|nr:hypothetical protein [Verrucomicrobiota bacterium]